ncbi:MAG: UvrD-helicase domain-containing protein [Azoarcus sp.]|jgi:exodeoxyribonuclease V beta subunit|nr:UvrD-helicase domain-containing protein [Azoarcus sp.]
MTPLPSAFEPFDAFACPLDGIALIEASAGTGKTWNICGLYLRQLLEKDLPVSRLLVVTFTRAATAELSARIRERIVAVLRVLEGGGVGGDPFIDALLGAARRAGVDESAMCRRLRGALATFDEAAIFTIHGFCQRALVDTPFAAGLPYALEVSEDDGDLRLETTQDFWRREISGIDGALAGHLLVCRDSPERWAQWLKEAQARPLAWVLWDEEDVDEAGEGDLGALSAALDGCYDEARRLWGDGADVRRAMDGATGLHKGIYKPEAIDTAFQSWAAWLAARDARAESGAGEGNKLDLLGGAKLAARTNKGKAPPKHPFFTAAQKLLDVRQGFDAALARGRMRLLRRFVEEAGAELRRRKQHERRAAFDDILWNAHDALASGRQPWLARALHTRYPVALIDEFQDTDPLQLAIFQRIYDCDGRHGSLFLVGDPKQAIYSFRGADLQTYLRARVLADAHYTLDVNRRSAPALVAACNTLFGANDAAFMETGLDFRPVRSHDPSQHLDDRTPSGGDAALRLWRIPRGEDAGNAEGGDDDGGDGGGAGGERLRRKEAIARAAAASAAEIARLLAAGARGDIRIGERPLTAGDIAVLVRTHNEGARMKAALAQKGVGSVELSQSSVFVSGEAGELEQVLRAIAEPSRERRIKAALATGLMGWDATALARLADDENGLVGQFERFAVWREDWLRRGFAFMAWRWMNGDGVASRLLEREDGERRLTNLLHLLELLQQEAGRASPAVLLGVLARRRAEGGGGDDALLRLESDRNLVRIVTIYRAKGLQYGIVFCPFLFDGYVAGQRGGPMRLWHDEDGRQVVDWRVDTEDEELIKEKLRDERDAETLRLIYVALTRAVHRCYLVTGCYDKGAPGKGGNFNESAHSLLNWLVTGAGIALDGWRKKKDWTPAEVDARWRGLAAASQGAIILDDLPSGEGARLEPETARRAFSAPRAPKVPGGWRLGSFSALMSGATHEDAARDHDARAGLVDTMAETLHETAVDFQETAVYRQDTAVDCQETAVYRQDTAVDCQDTAVYCQETAVNDSNTGVPTDDILRFPRGPVAGDCVHAVFEAIDFTRPETRAAAIDRALAVHAPATDRDTALLTRMLAKLVDDVLATPLVDDPGTPLRLETVPMARRMTELGFYLSAPRLAAAALGDWLAAHGYDTPKLAPRDLAGYLKGYIDLVFEHEGRYWVLDWKSNHLGDTPAAYAPAALAAVMARHGYHLQHLLYTVALHRHLAGTLPGYDYERHFGGVLYLFVRGTRPGWRIDGGQAGVFRHRAAKAAIESLDALLAGGAEPR